jgi:hypothetical protein
MVDMQKSLVIHPYEMYSLFSYFQMAKVELRRVEIQRAGAFSPILRSSSLFLLRDMLHRGARHALICAKSITKSQEFTVCPHALEVVENAESQGWRRHFVD